MEKDSIQQAAEREMKGLEYQVTQLISTIDNLTEENRTLRSHQETLVSERAKLIEKNDTARTRVESMINRLKSMEQGV